MNTVPASESGTPRAGDPSSEIPLEIHDLTVAYQKKPVLWGVDLRVPAGRLVGIVGPNGAGALKQNPAAEAHFKGLAPGYQCRFITWIAMAKRLETRRARIRESIKLLRHNQKLGLK